MAAAWLAAGACAHAEPFAATDPEPNPPLAALPARLTYNPQGDWYPTWLPDGSAIGYSSQPAERTNRDRCIAFLGVATGRIGTMVCPHAAHEEDSTNVASTNAVSGGGQLAVVVESSNPGLYAPAYRALWLGPVAQPDSLRPILSFPYTASSGLLHTSAANLLWLDEHTILYLAQAYQYVPGAIGIPPDTNDYGLEIAMLTISVSPTVYVVPGTSSATSVARDPVSHTVYATFAGDTRVYSLDILTGARQPVVDFGTLGIVRDVQVVNGRLAAVVGGRIRPVDPGYYGIPVQYDDGGMVFGLDLPSGSPHRINPDTTGFYRHIAMSPDGKTVAAERFPVTYTPITAPGGLIIGRDTTIEKASDLWLLGNP